MAVLPPPSSLVPLSSAVAPSRSPWTVGLRDYTAGVISGVGKVFAGYPFDFVKGRVQTGMYPCSRTAVRQIMLLEGPRAFYQGASTPTIGVCAMGGVVFYVNGAVRRWLGDSRGTQKIQHDFIAGCAGGFAVGLLVNPLEVLKLRMQVLQRTAAWGGLASASHLEGGNAPKNSALNSSRSSSSSSKNAHLTPNAPVGLLATARSLSGRQWAAAWHLTLYREMCTFGLFFPVNEYLRGALLRRQRRSSTAADAADAGHDEPLSIPSRVLAAGLAGILGWLPCYPADVVKSRVQAGIVGTTADQSASSVAGGCGMAGSEKGVLRPSQVQVPCARSVARELYRAEGWRGFARGLGPCLVRAFPAYGAQYMLFELCVTTVLPAAPA
jgi:solute carrier family 25 carnitine/acylcarnitine transporter 20/29